MWLSDISLYLKMCLPTPKTILFQPFDGGQLEPGAWLLWTKFCKVHKSKIAPFRCKFILQDALTCIEDKFVSTLWWRWAGACVMNSLYCCRQSFARYILGKYATFRCKFILQDVLTCIEDKFVSTLWWRWAGACVMNSLDCLGQSFAR
jgi:hypothetical protein